MWTKDQHLLPAVEDVVLDVFGVSVVAEVAVHLDLHEEVPDGRGGELEGPGEDPHGAGYKEEQVPEPDDGEYLQDWTPLINVM